MVDLFYVIRLDFVNHSAYLTYFVSLIHSMKTIDSIFMVHLNTAIGFSPPIHLV